MKKTFIAFLIFYLFSGSSAIANDFGERYRPDEEQLRMIKDLVDRQEFDRLPRSLNKKRIDASLETEPKGTPGGGPEYFDPLSLLDFTPIFPFQGSKMVHTPNFTWSAGGYDLFGLYLYLPFPTGYRLVGPIWRYQQPYFLMPSALWDYINMNGWCLWNISSLAGLVNLFNLTLASNQISDVYPLVINPGMDSGDSVDLTNNPLSIDSCAIYIPALVARGVYVFHYCP
jgi:hypothetical protein